MKPTENNENDSYINDSHVRFIRITDSVGYV